ncbi:MAG: GNAT family N-acetyltransferase [Geminicoccaceae bacterium]
MPATALFEVESRENWRDLLQLSQQSALQQAWAYGDAAAGERQRAVRVVALSDGEPVACAQIFHRRYPAGLGIALMMRAPVWLRPPAAGEETAILSAIRSTLPRTLTVWTPDDTDALAVRSGFHRIYTGYSTTRLDLRRSLAALRSGLDGKWRNMLCRAEEVSLAIREVRGGHALDWLVEANEAHRRKVGYRGPSPHFIRALGVAQAPGQRLVLVAEEAGRPVAGIIVDRHGRSATYYAGCTSDRGRELRCHHRLLWEAIMRLKDAGTASLDLGGIDTEKAAGVARFKLGLGGEPVTLAGSYLIPPPRTVLKLRSFEKDAPASAVAVRRREKRKGPQRRAALSI